MFQNTFTVQKRNDFFKPYGSGVKPLTSHYLMFYCLHLIERLYSRYKHLGPQTLRESLRKTLTSGLGLDNMYLAWPAVVQLLVFIYSGIQ